MALLTHQTQVSHPSNSFKRGLSYTNGSIGRSFATFAFVSRKDHSMLKFQLHPRGQPLRVQRRRPFKIICFKGNGQNNKQGNDLNSPKVSKSHIQLSCSHQETDNILSETINGQKYPISYTPVERGERKVVSSMAAKRLFRNWLVNLGTQILSDRTFNGNAKEEIEKEKEEIDEKEEKGRIESISCGAQQEIRSSNKSRVLRAVVLFLSRFDAAIFVPFLVFVPFYWTIRLMHGTEVARELTPLWILGPLIMAIYIKTLQKLFQAYSFLFYRAVQLLKNMPYYSSLVRTYLSEGKLKAYLMETLLDPFIQLRDLDYKAFSKQKLLQFKEWLIELYLDIVESIWPYYCRALKLLKKANLI